MSNRYTTLSPYFNHELLGAVINPMATSSILKVAQGAYGTPGAVAVAQLFNQPKMHVERAAAQPPAVGVSDIVANALLHARGPIERSADDRLDAEMSIRMAASVTREHRHLKIREYTYDEIIDVKWVPTLHNISDLCTKPLNKSTFLRHRDAIMPLMHIVAAHASLHGELVHA